MASVLYMSCFLLLTGVVNLLLILLLLELLSWSLVLMMEKPYALKYLVAQSMFLFLGSLGTFFSSPILTLAILLKMGLPPFHLWFLVLLSYFKKGLFLVMLTLHKLLPVLLISKIVTEFTNLVIQLTLLVSGISILQVSGVFFVFLVSSLVHSGWLILSSMMSLSLGLFYWSTYSFMVMLFVGSLELQLMKFSDLSQTSYSSLMWLTLSGIPPFTMFWLKLNIFYSLWMTSLSILLILISVMSVSSYYRAYHLSISMSKSHSAMLTQMTYPGLAVGIM